MIELPLIILATVGVFLVPWLIVMVVGIIIFVYSFLIKGVLSLLHVPDEEEEDSG